MTAGKKVGKKKTPLHWGGVWITKRRESYENKYSFTFHGCSMSGANAVKMSINEVLIKLAWKHFDVAKKQQVKQKYNKEYAKFA